MKTDEWLTPPEILEALGPFDLDPCAPRVRPWAMASEHYTIDDNGLYGDWHGRVWCNPPYGKETGMWLKRCAEHGNAIALIFARTETDHFFEQVWNAATGVLFLRGRLNFYDVHGKRSKFNSGAPSCLVAYGAKAYFSLRNATARGALAGRLVQL
ncbi:MAG: DNA N-6-adenine-methyltransferase [Acidobacteriota bacterium]